MESLREDRSTRMHYAALPVPNSAIIKGQTHDDAYQPRLVPVPGTKVPLAPFGVREPRQIIRAAVVASQISEDLLISKRRIRAVMQWRVAAYFALRDLMPKVSRCRAKAIMQRDRSTLIHHAHKRKLDPDYLADKVAAIKAVLV